MPARGQSSRCARSLGRSAELYAGGSEFDVELEFLRACGLREQELPYNPIIALNENAAVLHYQVLGRQAPEQRQQVSPRLPDD